jgi:hypothetical protein
VKAKTGFAAPCVMMAYLWVVRDTRDVLVVSADTCVGCLEATHSSGMGMKGTPSFGASGEMTKVLKQLPGELSPADLQWFQQYGVSRIRCRCKGTCTSGALRSGQTTYGK